MILTDLLPMKHGPIFSLDSLSAFLFSCKLNKAIAIVMDQCICNKPQEKKQKLLFKQDHNTTVIKYNIRSEKQTTEVVKSNINNSIFTKGKDACKIWY